MRLVTVHALAVVVLRSALRQGLSQDLLDQQMARTVFPEGRIEPGGLADPAGADVVAQLERGDRVAGDRAVRFQRVERSDYP